MEVVYYYDANAGYCPVKTYLAKYRITKKDTIKKKNYKIKILSNVNAKIEHVVQNCGNPTPPISSKLSGYDYFEIKHRKDTNILIRIFYFRYENKTVLLNALEKPDNYDTKKEKRKIDKQLEITKEYKNKFIKNPKLYEKYK